MTRRARLILAYATFALAGIAACSLNTQPIPPEDSTFDPGVGADSGTSNKGDAAIMAVPEAGTLGDGGTQHTDADASSDAAPDGSLDGSVDASFDSGDGG